MTIYSPIQTYADFKHEEKLHKSFENICIALFILTSLVALFVCSYYAMGKSIEEIEAKPYKTVAEYNEYKTEMK